MKKIILILVVLGTASASHFDVGIGYRRDHLRWQIGCDEVDIVSELTWRKLNILEGRMKYETGFCRRWLFWGEFAVGGILSGENQDSDFDRSGRQLEFSRSFSDTTGIAADATLGFGYRLTPCWTGQAGFSYRTLYLRDWGAKWVIRKVSQRGIRPPYEDIPKSVVVSTYQPELTTGFIGVEWRKCFEGFNLISNFQAHLGTYYAHADWKLRTDLDYHFDAAIMYGLVWNLNGEWRLSDCWHLTCGIGVAYWRDIYGVKGFVEHGEVTAGMYFGVQWVSLSANLGIRYCF